MASFRVRLLFWMPLMVAFTFRRWSLLGEEAFDTGNHSHWETLLSRADCPITGTHGAFSAKAQKLGILSEAPPFTDMTLVQPMANFGFDKEGKFPASTTHSISQEFDEVGRNIYEQCQRKRNIQRTTTHQNHFPFSIAIDTPLFH